MKEKRNDVLDFAERNAINVIPLERGKKTPLQKWKRYTKYRTSDKELEELQTDAKNIGFVCGEISDNLFVLDFDSEELYKKFFQKEVKGTTVVKTPHGYHIY